MSIIAWNCRGLGQAATVRALKRLNRRYRPEIVFLSETKQEEDYIEGLRRRLGFTHADYVAPRGQSGGLALWWRGNFLIQILSKCRNFFDLAVRGAIGGNSWHITFVYGEPRRNHRGNFVRALKELRRQNDDPWVLMGDFNLLGDVDEKSGGRPVKWIQCRLMQELLNDCELMDLGFNGQGFTWTNRAIKERLDRTVANSAWRTLFDKAQVYHEALLGSDHRPLVLKLCVWSRRRRNNFKFEAQWLEEKESREVINTAWNHNVRGSRMFVVYQKLKLSRTALARWSRQSLKSNSQEIEDLIGQLEDVQAQPYSVDIRKEEDELLQKLDRVWKKEELYWLQRSRIKWLRHGDRNTRPLHCKGVRD
ncbi:hypothetical protein Tsubulata_023831 [Turnera subulata]|uniref:Endonuclease/exonuclease/phosphatase domain-containing protein n=1 Tax=Turnera subulata TaxID=218843 RepID=A0A9Q0G461_9ROSI|nr:hypothetical protein Tsubulata_023831 [Turnera subulata]